MSADITPVHGTRLAPFDPRPSWRYAQPRLYLGTRTDSGWTQCRACHRPHAEHDDGGHAPMACPPADLSPDHRYHSLFDAAAAVGVDLVLDERFHPGAVEALCEWAARKNKSLGHRDCPPWTGVLYVRIPVAGTPDGRVFEVFQRGENRR